MKIHGTAVKISLFLSSLVAGWHELFRFTLHFQLLGSNCYFQWQVSKYQQIHERITFFLEERARGSIAGSYI